MDNERGPEIHLHPCIYSRDNEVHVMVPPKLWEEMKQFFPKHFHTRESLKDDSWPAYSVEVKSDE